MTNSNVQTPDTTVTVAQVKRSRGRPALDAAVKAKRETNRVMALLANDHNTNPLAIAQKGIRTTASFRFQAEAMVKAANGQKVKLESYGVRKSAKTVNDAIANSASLKTNKSAMAVIVFEARRAGNVATDETKSFLKRISAQGATFSPEEVPAQLQQFL